MSDTVKEAGKRNSAADMAKLATIHDAVVSMGYECPGTAASTSGGPWGWESSNAFAELKQKYPELAAKFVAEAAANGSFEFSELTEVALCP